MSIYPVSCSWDLICPCFKVESPGYDNGRGKYPQFADCKWTLEGPQGTNIVLQVRFTVFRDRTIDDKLFIFRILCTFKGMISKLLLSSFLIK